MLKRASVADVKQGRVRRDDALVVVVMLFYPRFLKKELVDEYRRELAPPAELFKEFKASARTIGIHNAAFAKVGYEARFELTPKGKDSLAELAAASHARDVVLVCQCASHDRCHGDLLLLFAKHRFQASIQTPLFDYPVFEARLPSM